MATANDEFCDASVIVSVRRSDIIHISGDIEDKFNIHFQRLVSNCDVHEVTSLETESNDSNALYKVTLRGESCKREAEKITSSTGHLLDAEPNKVQFACTKMSDSYDLPSQKRTACEDSDDSFEDLTHDFSENESQSPIGESVLNFDMRSTASHNIQVPGYKVPQYCANNSNTFGVSVAGSLLGCPSEREVSTPNIPFHSKIPTERIIGPTSITQHVDSVSNLSFPSQKPEQMYAGNVEVSDLPSEHHKPTDKSYNQQTRNTVSKFGESVMGSLVGPSSISMTERQDIHTRTTSSNRNTPAEPVLRPDQSSLSVGYLNPDPHISPEPEFHTARESGSFATDDESTIKADESDDSSILNQQANARHAPSPHQFLPDSSNLATGNDETVSGCQDSSQQHHNQQQKKSSDKTIAVSNFVHVETVLKYFQNTNKSGGGHIEKYIEDQTQLLITFTDHKAVKDVLSRSHTVEGVKLLVTPVEQIEKRPIDERSLFIYGIPDNVSQETLKLFINNRTSTEEEPVVTYGKKPGTAIVYFTQPLKDINTTINSFPDRLLGGVSIHAKPVLFSNSIRVKGHKDIIHRDTVEIYFDDFIKKEILPGSSCDHVRSVEVKSRSKEAIVTFNDWRVVDKVLSKQHRIEGVYVTLSTFFECIEDQNEKEHSMSRRHGIVLDVKSRSIMDFILGSENQHKELSERIMASASARLVWPHRSNPRKIRIEQITHTNRAEDTANWERHARRKFNELIKKYTAHPIKFHGGKKYAIENLLRPLDESYVKYNYIKENILVLIGSTDAVEQTKRQIEEVLRETTSEPIKKTPIALKTARLKQLEMCGIKQDVEYHHSDVTLMISEGASEVVFESKTDVSAAQSDMWKRFDDLFIDHPNLSQHQSRFVERAIEDVHATYQTKNIKAACDVSTTRHLTIVTVHGKTQRDCDRATEFLESEVHQATV